MKDRLLRAGVLHMLSEWTHSFSLTEMLSLGISLGCPRTRNLLNSLGGGTVSKWPGGKYQYFTDHMNSNEHLREELLIRVVLDSEWVPREAGVEQL